MECVFFLCLIARLTEVHAFFNQHHHHQLYLLYIVTHEKTTLYAYGDKFTKNNFNVLLKNKTVMGYLVPNKNEIILSNLVIDY